MHTSSGFPCKVKEEFKNILAWWLKHMIKSQTLTSIEEIASNMNKGAFIVPPEAENLNSKDLKMIQEPK